MTARAVPRLVAAALMALVLAGCSTSAGSSSSESPAATTTPASTASPTNDTVCTSLSAVKSSAATLKSDLQSKNLSAVTADINNLDTAFKALIAAMSSAAQARGAELQSAWDNVKTTFQGLSKSDIGQVQSKMQGPVDQLKTTLDSVTSGLNCA